MDNYCCKEFDEAVKKCDIDRGRSESKWYVADSELGSPIIYLTFCPFCGTSLVHNLYKEQELGEFSVG